jgi:hypothetical protein
MEDDSTVYMATPNERLTLACALLTAFLLVSLALQAVCVHRLGNLHDRCTEVYFKRLPKTIKFASATVKGSIDGSVVDGEMRQEMADKIAGLEEAEEQAAGRRRRRQTTT